MKNSQSMDCFEAEIGITSFLLQVSVCLVASVILLCVYGITECLQIQKTSFSKLLRSIQYSLICGH